MTSLVAYRPQTGLRQNQHRLGQRHNLSLSFAKQSMQQITLNVPLKTSLHAGTFDGAKRSVKLTNAQSMCAQAISITVT